KSPRSPLRLLRGNPGGFSEIGDQGAVETVEDGEVRLVRGVEPLPSATPQHLFKEDARLHRPQEHDELKVGDVHAGREQVHGDSDARLLAVAELSDSLEWAVHAPSDLLHEPVASAERIAADVN